MWIEIRSSRNTEGRNKVDLEDENDVEKVHKLISKDRR